MLLDSDPEAALGELDAAVALAASVDNHFLGGVAQASAATLRTRIGRPHDAIRPLARPIERLVDRGNLTHLLTTVRNPPTLLIALGQWEPTAELIGALGVATISPTFGDEAVRLDAAETEVGTVLGPHAYEVARSAGASRSLVACARRVVTVLDGLAVHDRDLDTVAE